MVNGPDYWGPAVEELSQFNVIYAQVERKPNDVALLRKCVVRASKMVPLFSWASRCLDPQSMDVYRTATRQIAKVAKDKTTPVDTLREAVDQYKTAMQRVLNDTAPEAFAYRGFKVQNPQHFSASLCSKALTGVDYLRALFKRRGVEPLIGKGIARITLTLEVDAVAYFHAGDHELVLSVPELAKGGAPRIIDDFANETLLHEFGHYVHRVFITGEAREAWNAPWEGVPSLADPANRYRRDDPKRKEQVDPLEVVTEYGKTDEFEDFAETFVAFMAAPERLTPTAKFRMERALSLSGLYGKPVTRLAYDYDRRRT